jgi:hypothetical protein
VASRGVDACSTVPSCKEQGAGSSSEAASGPPLVAHSFTAMSTGLTSGWAKGTVLGVGPSATAEGLGADMGIVT